MRFIELDKALSKNTEAVYLIEGEDFFLRSRACFKITQKAAVAYPELNSVTLSGEVNVEDITAACSVMPFLSEKRLVTVSDFQINSKNRKEIERLAAVENPTFCLIITNTAKCTVTSLKNVCVVNCDRLDIANVKRWIDACARREYLTVSDAVTEKIAAYCACDMSRVANEMAKLVNYCDEEITEEAVEECVIPDVEYKVFALTDSIAKRDVGASVEILRRLLMAGEEPTALVGMIYSNFKRMFFAKNSTASEEEIAKHLGVKPYAIKIARSHAEKFGVKRLREAMALCLRADEDIKTSNSDKNACVEWLVLAVAAG